MRNNKKKLVASGTTEPRYTRTPHPVSPLSLPPLATTFRFFTSSSGAKRVSVTRSTAVPRDPLSGGPDYATDERGQPVPPNPGPCTSVQYRETTEQLEGRPLRQILPGCDRASLAPRDVTRLFALLTEAFYRKGHAMADGAAVAELREKPDGALFALLLNPFDQPLTVRNESRSIGVEVPAGSVVVCHDGCPLAVTWTARGYFFALCDDGEKLLLHILEPLILSLPARRPPYEVTQAVDTDPYSYDPAAEPIVGEELAPLPDPRSPEQIEANRKAQAAIDRWLENFAGPDDRHPLITPDPKDVN